MLYIKAKVTIFVIYLLQR